MQTAAVLAAFYEKTKDKEKLSVALLDLSKAYATTGDWKTAEAYCRRSVSLGTSNQVIALHHLLFIFETTGQHEQYKIFQKKL
jgi:hypothetical protein